MAVAELIVSRRALLGAACAPLILGAAEPKDAILARHRGLACPEEARGPGSTFPPPPPQASWTPDRVRRDERWERALARYRGAEAALAAVEGTAEDATYDRALGSLNRALSRLLRTPAPHLAALAAKLDLLVAHQVWELNFAGPCLAALRRDARRLAHRSS